MLTTLARVARPPVGRHHVARPRVLRLLKSVADTPLTLITAPAGFGKTRLLAEWAASTAGPVSWLSLESGDNDPAVFARDLVKSVERVAPEAAQSALAEAERDAGPVRLVGLLLKGVAAVSDSIVTVIDDFHRVTESALNELCSSTIDELPDNWRWVIGSRDTPSLLLGRRRAEHSVTEVSLDDLRFTESEARDLLTVALGLDVSAVAVRVLNQRAGGWPVGLCLAALAATGSDNQDTAILSYTGRDKNLGQYFAEEVFTHLPDRLQDFLAQSSVLHILNADLCAHVTDSEDAAALLEDAVSHRLFIGAVDESDSSTYRQHDLFAEWLQEELDRRNPGKASELRRRAAAWCVEQNMMPEAVHYLLEAEDWVGCTDLLATHGYEMIQRGLHASVYSWVASLPESVLTEHGDIALIGGDAAAQGGKWQEAARFVALTSDVDIATPEGRSVRLGALVLSWLQTVFYGSMDDLQGVADEIERLRVNQPQAAHPRHPGEDEQRASAFIALVRFLNGDMESASNEVSKCRGLPGSATSVITIAGLEALIEVEQGNDGAAVDIASDAIATVSDADPPIGSILAALALVWAADEAGAGDAAAVVTTVAERAHLPQSPFFTALCNAELARRVGKSKVAAKELELARRLAGELGEPQFMAVFLEVGSKRFAGSGPLLGPGELSPREWDVLRFLPTQMTRREMSVELGISVDTVKSHTAKLYRKLGVASREEAVARARQLGLI